MTPEREQKFKNVIGKRQPDLTVVLENVHDPHNISAVLRTCDAVGIQEIYVIDTVHPKPKKYGKKSSSSAIKWVDINFYNNQETCMKELKRKYEKIYATKLTKTSTSLFRLDLTGSTALLFGNEKDGLTDEILAYTDGNFVIPQVGMIPSLNISVACAIALYEAYRQRTQQGMYDSQKLSAEAYEAIFQKWKGW